MPYDNVPEADWDKMDRCVAKLEGEHGKESAIAICYTSIVEGKSVRDAVDSYERTKAMTLGDGEESLNSRAARISEAFYKAYPSDPALSPGGMSFYLVETFPSYVVAAYGMDYYRVPFTEADGKITFATRVDWAAVQPLTEWIAKAGRRHSASDVSKLQDAHDALVALGAECFKEVSEQGQSLFFTKDAKTDKWRWVGVSSSAYEDRDDEIITKQALVDDVDYADATGEYGPVLWWHCDGRTVDGDKTPLIKLGFTDFNAMQGNLLIESGLIDHDVVGASLAEHRKELSISIGFLHPEDEPDNDGIIRHIRRKERSFLPREAASNRVARLLSLNRQEDTAVDDKKEKRLREMLGPSADLVITGASKLDDAAKAAKLRWKQQQEKEEGDKQPAAEKEKADAEQKDEKQDASKDRKLSDLTVDEFVSALKKGMQPDAKKEVVDGDKQKETSAAVPDAQQVTPGDMLAFGEVVATRFKSVDDALQTVLDVLGEVPNGVKQSGRQGYRASGAEDTIRGKSVSDTPDHPHMDPQLAQVAGIVDMLEPKGNGGGRTSL